MKIQSSTAFQAPAKLNTTAPAASEAPAAEPQDSVQTGNIHGTLSRATYGAALYGIPSLAGATMGTAGILPAVVLGAGIGAITHPERLKDAVIFGTVGAAVGAGAGYVGSLLAGTPYAWIPVVASTVVGAGTQAAFSALHEQQQ